MFDYRHQESSASADEAAAAGLTLKATLLLSIEATRGVLVDVLHSEHIPWRTVELD